MATFRDTRPLHLSHGEFEDHPVALIITQSDGLIRQLNRSARLIFIPNNLAPLATHIQDLLSVSPTGGDQQLLAAARETVRLTVTLADRNEHERWTVSADPFGDAGDETMCWEIVPAGYSGCRFPDEAAWLRYVSDASFAFSRSLNVSATLQEIARQAIPGISDWCTIDLLDGGDQYLRRVAVAHADVQKARGVRAVRRRYPVTDVGRHPVLGVVSNGVPALIPEFTEAFLRATSVDETHYAFIKNLGLHSSMIFPLIVSDECIGALTFSSAESQRTYSHSDIELVSAYVERAAQALGLARHHEEAEQVSRIREHYLSVASHEIRTPLAVVGGFASLLVRQFTSGSPDPERVDVLVGELQHGVERLELLTEDLLVASSLQQPLAVTNREEVDLVELAASVIQRLEVTDAEAGQGRIVLDGDSSVIGYWNASLLERALSNLVGNAIKYSPDNLLIHVSVLQEPGGIATVIVSDQGMGIEDEDLDTLFLPFQRGNNARKMSGGTGLGLYITKQVVEQHHGSIDVTSQPGKGSTFVMKLPAYPPSGRERIGTPGAQTL